MFALLGTSLHMLFEACITADIAKSGVDNPGVYIFVSIYNGMMLLLCYMH